MIYKASDRRICGHIVCFCVIDRKVTARIYDCAEDARLYIDNMDTNVHIVPYGKEYDMRLWYDASATCHPDDEFDEELGKRIAYRRLLRKYLTARNKRIALFIRYLGLARRELSVRHRKVAQHIDSIDPEYGVR